MRRNGFHNNLKKERIIMTASAVFVLAALTMTGIYVKQSSRSAGDDGYTIDFSALEDAVDGARKDLEGSMADSSALGRDQINMDDDLDYFPPLTEADSDEIKIPGLTSEETGSDKNKTGTGGSGSGSSGNTGGTKKTETPSGQDAASQNTEQETLKQQTLADEAAMAADAANEQGNMEGNVETLMDEANANAEANLEGILEGDSGNALQGEVVSSFGAGDSLVWPVNGNVLITYNTDRTVYFATLKAYKYNPGIVMSAAEGDVITAAASGVVKEVFYNEEIGNAVRIDIGRGYEAVYGQLKDIQVSAGSVVDVGTVLGYIAAPTKYYRVEGCNAYFALEKDGQPVDPLGQLQ